MLVWKFDLFKINDYHLAFLVTVITLYGNMYQLTNQKPLVVIQ